MCNCKPFSETSAPENGNSKQKQAVKMLHINARSLRKKTDETEANLADKGIDILCITEHWLTNYEINVVQIHGYKLGKLLRQEPLQGLSLETGNVFS